MSKLILARHGQSEWNKLGKWTGLTDVGRHEAQRAGLNLASIAIDAVYTSPLKRCLSTVHEILGIRENNGVGDIPVIKSEAITEKNYGVLTGKNKFEVRDEVGEEEFMRIRRSWDYQIEDGESLKQVHARVAPFHHGTIMPRILGGENILVVSHNNTLRAYVKEIEDIPEDMVGLIELGTAEMRSYDLGEDGQIQGRTVCLIGAVH